MTCRLAIKRHPTMASQLVPATSHFSSKAKVYFYLRAYYETFLGGKLGVLPIDARGQRVRNQIGVICAHGTAISDFCVLPFKDNLLATASRDDKVC